MNAEAKTSDFLGDDFVMLYGIPWSTYERILDALGEYHLRHTYDRGTLEMRRILCGVAWEDYQKFLDATPDYKLRHTYDQGTLEIMMSPRKDHEWVASLLARMVESMTFALNIPIQTVGSTTLTAPEVRQGLQPDASFYIANESRVRGKDTYESSKDPPPDLVVEVDVTSSSVPRLPSYAKIGVPEIWRHDGKAMRFYALTAGDYRETDRSVSFPFVGDQDVTRFLDRRRQTDEHSLVREFVAWAQEAYAAQKT